MAIALELAHPQHRCVTRSQLLAAGLSDQEVRTLRERDLLRKVLTSVYLVGDRTLSREQHLQAAILASGPEVGLSHLTACEQRTLIPVRHDVVEVTSARLGLNRKQRTQLPLTATGRPGLVWVTGATRGVAVEQAAGFPVTTLGRTLIDVAGRHRERVARRVWREADFQGLLEPADLTAALASGRRPGAAAIRRIWGQEGIVGDAQTDLRSRNEMRFLRMVLAAGLPRPRTNVRLMLGGRIFTPDAYWPELGLAVELDGGGHRRRFAGEADDARDIVMLDHEIETLRFTDDDVYSRGAWCISVLREAIERRRTQLAQAA